MATNIFGILTALVLATAVYIAHKNQTKYEEEIANTRTEKDKLKASQDRFERARVKLADTIAERNGVDEENTKLTADEASQRKSNEETKSKIEASTAKVNSNKRQLDEIREKTAKVGDIRELASKMSTLRTEIEELNQSISANETKQRDLEAQNTQADTQLAGMRKRSEIMSSGQSLPTLKSRIRTIYPSWGFVTLADGNSSGVVANSSLDVVRDGNVIAKLLVSTVESSTASASIVPDSIAPDTTLMVGDTVVASAPAKVEAPAPTAPAPAAEAPTPAPLPDAPSEPAATATGDNAEIPASGDAPSAPATEPAAGDNSDPFSN